MKNLLIKIKIVSLVGLLYSAAINSSFAQSNVEAKVQAPELWSQVKLYLSDFETNASEIKTNQFLVESQTLVDKKMGGMEHSIEAAINTLRFTRSNMDRKQRAALWFDVLATIDRYSDTNVPSVDISGWVSPPPGYKGKVGPWGMMPPDTNDVADYAYYVAAVKANKERAKSANFQHALQRINDWGASPGAEEFLRGAYSSSVTDKQEFDELLGQSSLSDTRKQKLRSLFNEVH